MEYTAPETKTKTVTKLETGKPTFWEAFRAAQKDFTPLKRSGKNEYFHTNYSTLNDVMESVLPALDKHGFVLFQSVEVSAATGNPLLKTVLRHTPSGTEEDSTYPLYMKETTPQGLGGSITYAKRYAITTLLGLLADEDDDGNRASLGKKKEEITKKVTQAFSPAPQKGGGSSYVVKFGKFKGQSLESIDPAELANYMQFLTGKGDLNGPAEEFVNAASDYLESRGYSDL